MSAKLKDVPTAKPLSLDDLKRHLKFVTRHTNGDEEFDGVLDRELSRSLLCEETNPRGTSGNRTVKSANIAKLRHELQHNFDRRLSVGNLLVMPGAPFGYKIESLQHRAHVVADLDLKIPMTFVFSERSIHGRGAGTKSEWSLKDLLQHYGVEKAVYAAEAFTPIAEITTGKASHLTPRQQVEFCYNWPGFLDFVNTIHIGNVYYRAVVDASAYVVFLLSGAESAKEFNRQVRTGIGATRNTASFRRALEDIRVTKAAGSKDKRTNLNTRAITVGLFYALKFAGVTSVRSVKDAERLELRKEMLAALKKTVHGRVFLSVTDEVLTPGKVPAMRKDIDSKCPIK